MLTKFVQLDRLVFVKHWCILDQSDTTEQLKKFTVLTTLSELQFYPKMAKSCKTLVKLCFLVYHLQQHVSLRSDLVPVDYCIFTPIKVVVKIVIQMSKEVLIQFFDTLCFLVIAEFFDQHDYQTTKRDSILRYFLILEDYSEFFLLSFQKTILNNMMKLYGYSKEK